MKISSICLNITNDQDTYNIWTLVVEKSVRAYEILKHTLKYFLYNKNYKHVFV